MASRPPEIAAVSIAPIATLPLVVAAIDLRAGKALSNLVLCAATPIGIAKDAILAVLKSLSRVPIPGSRGLKLLANSFPAPLANSQALELKDSPVSCSIGVWIRPCEFSASGNCMVGLRAANAAPGLSLVFGSKPAARLNSSSIAATFRTCPAGYMALSPGTLLLLACCVLYALL